MALFGNPYQMFANRFRPSGMMGGFMPQIQPFQSAISMQPGSNRFDYNQMAQNLYRPITQQGMYRPVQGVQSFQNMQAPMIQSQPISTHPLLQSPQRQLALTQLSGK